MLFREGPALDTGNCVGFVETRDAVASLYPAPEDARITCAIVDAGGGAQFVRLFATSSHNQELTLRPFVQWSRAAELLSHQPPQLPPRLFQPLGVRQGVGAEGFELAFLFVVEEGAVEAEGAGFGVVDEAGGVVGAHLEEDAQLEFAEGFAAEEAAGVVVAVAGGDDVEAVARAFGEEGVEEDGGVGRGVGVAGAEAVVVFVAELVEFLEAVDEDEGGGRGAGRFVAGAAGHVVGEALHDLREVALFGGGDGVGNELDDAVEELARGGAGGAAVADDEAQAARGELRGEGEERGGEDGEHGFVALADEEEVVAALAQEGGLGGAFDRVGRTEPDARRGGAGEGLGGEERAQEWVFADVGGGVAFEDNRAGIGDAGFCDLAFDFVEIGVADFVGEPDGLEGAVAFD